MTSMDPVGLERNKRNQVEEEVFNAKGSESGRKSAEKHET